MTELEILRTAFEQGVGANGSEEAKALLGVSPDADDYDLAVALVRSVALSEIEQIQVAPAQRLDPRPQARPSVVIQPYDDRSLLGRLETYPEKGRIDIHTFDDLRTLTAVLRAGRFRLRRAAARQIGMLLKSSSSEKIRLVAETLSANRDVEIAYEIQALQRELPGATGRKTRSDSSEWRRLAEEFERNVAYFWEGSLMVDPLALMPADKRAQLLLRTRDLHDESVVYLAAVLEGSDGISTPEQRIVLLQSLHYAGEPRLVPSLRTVLETGTPQEAIEAARALGRIDDPRVHPALVQAFERSLVEKEKIVLAGALGHVGDARGAGYVRNFLESQDSVLVQLALEAMESLGSTEDSESLALLLEHKDPEVIVRTVRALGRLGDVRALIPLRRIVQATTISAFRAEAEDALNSVRSRMDLRGEDVPENVTAVHAMEAVSNAQLSAKRDPASVKLRSYWDWSMGLFWMMIGFSRKAVARFESAAARRPGWVNPLLSIGMIHARRDRTAQALTAFRRAIEADRGHVEHNPLVTRTLALCFLRRAEQVEHDGRSDVARSLLEEVLTLDLRYVPASVLFELRRRREAFRARTAA